LAMLSGFPVTHVFVITRHRHRDVSQALRGLQNVTPVQQKPPFTLLGALASVEGLVTEPFLVIHGDNYLSHDLEHLAREVDCTRRGSWPEAVFATAEQDSHGDVAGRLASTGCYVLSPRVFGLLRELLDGDDLRSLTAALLESGAVVRAVPLRGMACQHQRAAGSACGESPHVGALVRHLSRARGPRGIPSDRRVLGRGVPHLGLARG
jgi:NDP-sugar pyrophosphorylase family protein